MVLRIKEREEAIQLITMDPKVCGKLLTLHRRGYGVEVEALRDRFPLRQIAGKGPKMGSHGYRRLRLWKSGFVAPWMFSGYKSIYIYRRKKQAGGATRGPRGWGRALLPHGRLVASLTSTPSLLVCFRSNKDHHEGFIPFGIPFLQNSKIGKKQKLALGLRLIGQSQK